jgi:hypothetical protein
MIMRPLKIKVHNGSCNILVSANNYFPFPRSSV